MKGLCGGDIDCSSWKGLGHVLVTLRMRKWHLPLKKLSPGRAAALPEETEPVETGLRMVPGSRGSGLNFSLRGPGVPRSAVPGPVASLDLADSFWWTDWVLGTEGHMTQLAAICQEEGWGQHRGKPMLRTANEISVLKASDAQRRKER